MKKTAQANAVQETQRLDKWLWAARFYKTRALAVEAINGGKVHVNGQRAKPGRSIRINDELTVSKPPYEHAIQVLSLQMQRRPATEAQQLYQESEESIAKRTLLQQQLKNEPLGFRH
ncbi:RNA-binding S4 domain-containing protein, partial [Methylophaga lonarensis]|uniref:RNA-binding S4 domain-containing protein n=1 Tax=Methylophaga lonarensis TaxID=999151 RepID=UPI003D2727DB